MYNAENIAPNAFAIDDAVCIIFVFEGDEDIQTKYVRHSCLHLCCDCLTNSIDLLFYIITSVAKSYNYILLNRQ